MNAAREVPTADRYSGPVAPDYPRLRAELERGSYPFLPEDEGELFGRCEWLEAQNVTLRNALDGLLEWCRRHQGGDPSLDPEEYYIARDYAQIALERSGEGE